MPRTYDPNLAIREVGYSLLTRRQQVRFWAFHAGLDLLPAVNDARGLRRTRGVRGLRGSRNGWLGATPSDISFDGERCYSLLAWRHRHIKFKEVERWELEDRLNILLHTRTVRAIHLAGGRISWAKRVQEDINAYLGVELPWVSYGQHRGARALFFRIEPHLPLASATIRANSGHPRRIKFCADGDTVPVVGIAEGVKGGEIVPRGFDQLDPFPTLAIEQVIGLWNHLRQLYGDGPPIGSPPVEDWLAKHEPLADDEFFQWLKHWGKVVGRSPEGHPLVVCPWHYHINTRVSNRPALYITGTATRRSKFLCPHPTCAQRTLMEYINKFGYGGAILHTCE